MPYKPRATFDNPYGPQVTFRTEDVLPPTAVYVSMGDTIVAQFQSNVQVNNLRLALRLLLPDGTMQCETYNAVQSSGTLQFYYIVIPPVEGYLLSALAQGGTVGGGSLWCWCNVYRGEVRQPVTSLPPSGGLLLMQGYLNIQSSLAWPNSPVAEAGTGAGSMRSIPITTLNGVSWLQRVPPLTRWEILGVSFGFTTSAAGGTRQVALAVLDATGIGVLRFPSAFTQAASQAYEYQFFPGAANLQTTAPPVRNTAPLSTPLLLDGFWSMQCTVQGLDAADSWAGATMTVREWCGVGET